MDALNRPLFFVWLCFRVVQTEASSWTIQLPSSVKALPGSCVVIPCLYDYPYPGEPVSTFTGIWTDETSHVIYHPVTSKIIQQFRSRTELVGDVTLKNCSLMIDPVQQSDQGPFTFRIEIEGYNSYSYYAKKVSLSMIDKLEIDFSVDAKVVEGQAVQASCSVSFSCPSSPPVFNWSHSGEEHVDVKELGNGEWKATANLTFHATSADHNKPLLCSVTLKGMQALKKSKVLTVKHAPVNVKVEHKSEVKEGEAVQLKCSSDAHPPASRYEWHSETGALLHQGNIYTLSNVSRHMDALYCTASNSQGRGKSSPVQLRVLYAPEIKTISSCSSEDSTVKCVCIAESKPPCMVQFVLSDRVLPGTKVEHHDSVTVGTLQADVGFPQFVLCLANNTEGEANLRLLSANGRMYTLKIAIGIAAVLVLAILTAGFIIKCRRRSADTSTLHMSTIKENKAAEPSQCTSTQRKEMDYDDVQLPSSDFDDHVYGNMESDEDEAIYSNV